MADLALTKDELAALETLAALGPDRGLDRALRGRLALYKLIDETPAGWQITALGRATLAKAKPTRGQSPAEAPAAQELEAPRGDGKRHYGRKNRDTSWLD